MKLFVVRNRDGDIIDKDGYDPIENADDIPFAEFSNYFYEDKEEAEGFARWKDPEYHYQKLKPQTLFVDSVEFEYEIRS
jgi:hypothetical protein